MFAYVAEDQNCANDVSVGVLDRRAAVVYRNLGSVSPYQEAVVCQAEDAPLLYRSQCGVLNRLAIMLVDDAEDGFERLTLGFCRAPSGQGLCDGIHEGDRAAAVGGDHGVADACERDGEPFALITFPGFILLSLLPQSVQVFGQYADQDA